MDEDNRTAEEMAEAEARRAFLKRCGHFAAVTRWGSDGRWPMRALAVTLCALLLGPPLGARAAGSNDPSDTASREPPHLVSAAAYLRMPQPEAGRYVLGAFDGFLFGLAAGEAGWTADWLPACLGQLTPKRLEAVAEKEVASTTAALRLVKGALDAPSAVFDVYGALRTVCAAPAAAPAGEVRDPLHFISSAEFARLPEAERQAYAAGAADGFAYGVGRAHAGDLLARLRACLKGRSINFRDMVKGVDDEADTEDQLGFADDTSAGVAVALGLTDFCGLK
jgi:hypothetical protein